MDQHHEQRRRRRPALSCIECRRRKIKCDRKGPCAQCLAAKIQCAYKYYGDVNKGSTQEHGRLQAPNTPSVTISSEHGRPLDTASLFNRAASSLPIENPVEDISRHYPQPLQIAQQDQHATTNLQGLLQPVHMQMVQDSLATNPIFGLTETGRDILEHQSGLQNSQIILNKTRTLRWSHWMGTAPEVRFWFLYHM
jgi:hypothetical protein